MLVRDTKDQYGLVSVLLHWSVALGVITLLTTGTIAFVIGRSPLRTDLLNFHLSVATLTAPLIVLRLIWRSRNGKPKLPPQGPVLERTASAVWRLLLMGMLFQLFTGPYLAWMHKHPIGLIGFWEIPYPLPETSAADMAQTYAIAHAFHMTVGFAVLGLVLLHAAGALKHAIVDRDGVLLRMIKPGARAIAKPRPTPAAVPDATPAAASRI
jgi:cytochrome b561